MEAQATIDPNSKHRPRLLLRLAVICAVALGTLATVVMLAVPVLIQTNLLRPFRIPTGAMTPTIQPGDLVLVEGVSLRSSRPRRGEIVVF